MIRLLLRFFGLHMARRAVASGRAPSIFDPRPGFALFRDRRVSAGTKLLALLLGAALAGMLVSLELPLEGIVAALLTLPGIALDLMIDGLEVVIAPLLFASLVLPHLVQARTLVMPSDGEEDERASVGGRLVRPGLRAMSGGSVTGYNR